MYSTHTYIHSQAHLTFDCFILTRKECPAQLQLPQNEQCGPSSGR